MSVEVILGSNTLGTGSSWQSAADSMYAEPSLVAAWSGPATSVTCFAGSIAFTVWDGADDFKMLVWNSSDVLVGVSDVLAATPAGAFLNFTFSSGFTIVKGDTYRQGWVSKTAGRFQNPNTFGTGGSVHLASGGNWTTPANWTENFAPEATKHLSGYLEAETAPGPAINTQPQGIAGVLGATPAFVAAATTSGGTLTAQWQASANGETWSAIAGATSTTGYTVPPLTPADNGRYFRVVFSDDNGSTTSIAVRSWVSGLPSAGKGRRI